jgi:response regulator RpfG family c-di-GMP phosphodiesterase
MPDNEEKPADKALILIIDDEPLSIEMLTTMLTGEYHVLMAANAQEAMELLNASTPDLILLDIVMPGMDGYAICRSLKADVRYRDIPVLFITVMNEAECEFQGLEMGAVDYIVKPYNPSLVKLRIKNHIELKQQRDLLYDRATELHHLNQELADEIARREHLQTEHEQLIQTLQETLAEVKTLSGLLPICSACRKVRDDQGYWSQLESYLSKHMDVEFSHGLCVECAKRLYPAYYPPNEEGETEP